MIQMDKLRDWLNKYRGIFAGEKKIKWILLIGLLGMLLIFLSEFLPKGNDPPEDAVSVSAQNEAYCRQTEEKLVALVQSIQGAGQAKVWVTLESGAEYVYLREQTRSTDTAKDYNGESVTSLREKDNSEETYLLVNQNGEEQPLLQKQLEPTVQGVVVVCEGASRPQVAEQVTNAVICALGISSNRVYVAQLTKP